MSIISNFKARKKSAKKMGRLLVGILALLFATSAFALPNEDWTSLSKRQLITLEIYCKVDPDLPECKMLAALGVHNDGGPGESKEKPEKRFDMFGAFQRTCLEHPDLPACVQWN
jgi:hypothetical protein